MGANATSFKEGLVPWNVREDGAQRLTKKNGWQIKINGRFVYKHRYIWEQHNGPLKENEIIVFLDGNKSNCVISNLRVVNRSERMFLIKMGYLTDNPKENEALIALAKLKTKVKERRADVKS